MIGERLDFSSIVLGPLVSFSTPNSVGIGSALVHYLLEEGLADRSIDDLIQLGKASHKAPVVSACIVARKSPV